MNKVPSDNHVCMQSRRQRGNEWFNKVVILHFGPLMCACFLCVVNKTLDHYQRLSCAPVPPQWAFWPLTINQLRVDQYKPAKTHTQAHRNTHDLTHRGFLYVSFITEETLDYRPLCLFSLLYPQHKSYSGNNADISAKCRSTLMWACLYLVDEQLKQ